jgi:hypothetical protein
MLIQRASAPVLLTAFLVAAAAMPAAAQSAAPAASPAAMAPAPAATHKPIMSSQLIKVSACHPSLNLMQSGGYYGGFAPGFYGGGVWPDAYGVGFYQPPVTTSNPQLAIDYMNISHKTMKQIEFGLVVNGILRAEVKDAGTFSPNAEIKHRFGLSANVFPIQSGLPQCFPLRITFEDGTKWRNPRLPPKNQHIYVHP